MISGWRCDFGSAIRIVICACVASCAQSCRMRPARAFSSRTVARTQFAKKAAIAKADCAHRAIFDFGSRRLAQNPNGACKGKIVISVRRCDFGTVISDSELRASPFARTVAACAPHTRFRHGMWHKHNLQRAHIAKAHCAYRTIFRSRIPTFLSRMQMKHLRAEI